MKRNPFLHDKILLQPPIETTDEIVHILKKTMEEAGKALLKIVPVEAGVVVVESWGREMTLALTLRSWP
jgi:DNA polymerase I-like protein with 3'-5' exonuclease and polymerase domains